LINGELFSIRRNLWFALYHFRGCKKATGRDVRRDGALTATNRREKAKKPAWEDGDFVAETGTSEPWYSSQNLLGWGKTRKSGMVNSITVDKPLTIWIDAICINQDDIIERGAQVQIMGEIYQTAWRLRIWLGEHSSNTIPAMENFSLVDGGIKLFLDGDID
jgi:hypothetical protein